MVKRCAKVVKSFKPLTILANYSIFDVWQCSEYASEITLKQSHSNLNGRPEVFFKILRNLQEITCVRVSSFNKVAGAACNFTKKETLAQVFSCEFFKISNNTFFYRTPPVTASVVPRCGERSTRKILASSGQIHVQH